jgi:hypothetical protein
MCHSHLIGGTFFRLGRNENGGSRITYQLPASASPSAGLFFHKRGPVAGIAPAGVAAFVSSQFAGMLAARSSSVAGFGRAKNLI